MMKKKKKRTRSDWAIDVKAWSLELHCAHDMILGCTKSIF